MLRRPTGLGPRSPPGPTAGSHWMPRCAWVHAIAPGLTRNKKQLLRHCARPPFALARLERSYWKASLRRARSTSGDSAKPIQSPIRRSGMKPRLAQL